MSVYLISNNRVTNQELFDEYVQEVIPMLLQHQAKFLVVGDGHKVLEGNPQPRTVVFEFESEDALNAWYHSPEYRAIMHKRQKATADAWVIVAEQFVMPEA